MALRCSLLGHDYGDAEVEHEREERGSEVVVTVQEFEECARCGDRNVISENTEVRSISTEADVDSFPDAEREAEPTDSDAVEPPTDEPVEPDVDGTTVEFDEGETDAELIDADADSPATGASGTETRTATAGADDDDDEFDVPTDENGEPVTDDGEILDDDETAIDRDRGHGEWPDSDDVGPPVDAETEPTEWPDADDPATATAATTDSELEDPADPDEPITDDAIVLEDDTGSMESGVAADARSMTAAQSNETDGDALEAEPRSEPAETDDTTGSGIERATTAPEPGQDDASRKGVPTEFYCPNCNYVAAGDRSSLRAGDICPECRKGYLGERDRR
ncbi:hypothetical protein RBH26_11395 [Natronolimnohabitans sp. A-GB9]|uniref:DUF7093 family protein n=1 Tax=Natronolimnohabitans sp. A-GB9 TaxID=3069757 RepID=UPI0027B6CD52|nr:hypothetical protein [Natronolimnohabitans sp. A-GB9]MDQ2051085.1 hypothetical protein [Natronolimnohabitans sp. A-GB9]